MIWCRSGRSTTSGSSGKQPHAFEDQRSSHAPFPLERRVPPDLRSASPGVPWKQVIDLWNILVHAYFRVDPDEIWVVVDRDIPALREAVVALLSATTDTEDTG